MKGLRSMVKTITMTVVVNRQAEQGGETTFFQRQVTQQELAIGKGLREELGRMAAEIAQEVEDYWYVLMDAEAEGGTGRGEQ